MTLLPIASWWVIVGLAALALVAIWWNPSSKAVLGESTAAHWRLTTAVLLLAVAAVRPGVPGDETEVSAANLNVYFVVDTTSSVIAEDWGDGSPRVAGIRTDIADIVLALSGARYSIVTFDQAARVRLPLTTDTTALDAALATLLPEPSEYSSGTSVTVANERLKTLLEQSVERHPERGRIVFYLGDGEHTAANPPTPFALQEGLINGGAVLGYGTTEGGRMKSTRARYDAAATYIQDPQTGEDAVSVIDETRLKEMAGQLGVPYLHRVAGESVLPAINGVDLARYGTTEDLEKEKIRTRQELYWLFLIGVAGVAAWELGRGFTGLVETRRRKETRP